MGDLLLVDQIFKHSLILELNALPTLHPDVTLEIIILIACKVVNLLLFLQISTHRITVKLAFVHLKSQSDLSSFLNRELRAILV